MQSKENCGVCGSLLVYQTEAVVLECAFCHQEQESHIFCPQGHYICDSCHERETLEILKELVEASVSRNPGELLETIMAHPSVPMHGPEHHFIVPAVIVAAVRNAGYPVPAGAIDKAISRGSKVPGGWCGLYGACGAGIGLGIAVSVLGEATPLRGKPRSRAIEATSFALSHMIDGQPRCCKRASRTALETAVQFLQEKMDIHLESGNRVTCSSSHRNQECPTTACAYYPK